jgi:alcohol dehydrogenase class IV
LVRGAFDWRDGERLIRFGRGVAAEPVEALGGPGYLLLTTSRAGAMLPAAVEAAAGVHHVPAGGVPELAAAALEWVRRAEPPVLATAAHSWARPHGARIVALGGGRVVDVAKAVAAALGERSGEASAGDEAPGRGRSARAMAIPTTLSGAEMTRAHRHATGVAEETPRVRCAVVLCDPALAASMPPEELAASALNALGHAVEGPCTVAANPVATLAAHEAARLLVGGFGGSEPDRDALALGALLAGYTLDSTGYGLHHVLAQTLVRHGLAGHGRANALLLPYTAAALRRRFPAELSALEAAVGEDPAGAAARLRALTGVTRLAELGVTAADLDACVESAAARPQLDATPPRPGREELREIYAAAL